MIFESSSCTISSKEYNGTTDQQPVQNIGATDKEVNKIYKVNVFKIDSSLFFGFDIFEGDKKIIHQEIIPFLQGNRNFINKSDAHQVGDLMVLKIMNGTFPPSITKHDLDSIGIK